MIELWTPTERTAYVITDWDGNVLEVGPTLSADEVICDMCGELVILRPVPLVDGYALCDECLPKIVPNWYDQIPPDVLEAWYEQREEFYRRFGDDKPEDAHLEAEYEDHCHLPEPDYEPEEDEDFYYPEDNWEYEV